MSIKPLDMQVMIPKTQKVASIRHLEQQKSNLNQEQLANTMKKEVRDKTQHVVKSNQNHKANSEADAKKKGKNSYSGQGKKKNKKTTNENKSKKTTMHHIDIRI